MSDKWEQLEAALHGIFGCAKVRADGHELTIQKCRDGEKLVTQVHVDGWIKGEWTKAENGQPAHPEARFWCPKRHRVYPVKKHAALKKIFGKKKADDMTALRVYAFMPYWGSPRALVRHLKKHFPDAEIIGSEASE